jgi:hypothetical protein
MTVLVGFLRAALLDQVWGMQSGFTACALWFHLTYSAFIFFWLI